ncbi:hypothetical protein ASG90_18725 [Nocardioides sp. Soil797]|nr:hypothetical protein ASG90_18725 [Nocardioides sp. Soil797]
MNPLLATSRRTHDSLWVRMAARLTGRSAVAVLVAALVVGILGMHALASHGASSTPMAPTPSSTMSMTGTAAVTSAHEAAMVSGDSHNGHAHSAQSSMAAAGSSPEVGADRGSASGHGMESMVMLCVVMLAAAALTLLALLATGFLRRLHPEAFMPAAVRGRMPQWVRSTGPPHQWQFSVIRC